MHQVAVPAAKNSIATPSVYSKVLLMLITRHLAATACIAALPYMRRNNGPV